MPNGNDLRNYVQKALKKGHSEKTIRTYLTKKKYSKSDIDTAFVKKELPKFNPKLRMIEIIAAAVIVVVILTFFLGRVGSETCTTDICFIQNAQECKDTTYIKEEAGTGSFVLYEIKDCNLEKSIQTFAEDEPIEIRDLFVNKKMACAYSRGGFDETWIESIVAGIDACDGALKDAIFEVRLAQFELLE